jgi:hypothetical protein
VGRHPLKLRQRFRPGGQHARDTYSDAVGVLGTLGWIVVAIAVFFAHIAERPRLAAVFPAVWFGLLVGGAFVAAAAIGPAADRPDGCESDEAEIEPRR